jgi:enoyl-CoA hydratase/carnithine racemase
MFAVDEFITAAKDARFAVIVVAVVFGLAVGFGLELFGRANSAIFEAFLAAQGFLQMDGPSQG